MNRTLFLFVLIATGAASSAASAQEIERERDQRRIQRQSQSEILRQREQQSMEFRERERQRAMLREEERDRARERRDDDGFSPAIAVYGTAWDTEDEPGWGAGGKLEIPLLEALHVEARGAWVDGVQVEHDDDAELDVVPIDLGLALHVPGDLLYGRSDRERELWVRPLIFGGASWVFFDGTDQFDADDEVGWYAGGGLEVGPEEGLGLLVEVMYRGVDVELENDITGQTDDTDIDGATANAGIYYRW